MAWISEVLSRCQIPLRWTALKIWCLWKPGDKFQSFANSGPRVLLINTRRSDITSCLIAPSLHDGCLSDAGIKMLVVSPFMFYSTKNIPLFVHKLLLLLLLLTLLLLKSIRIINKTHHENMAGFQACLVKYIFTGGKATPQKHLGCSIYIRWAFPRI